MESNIVIIFNFLTHVIHNSRLKFMILSMGEMPDIGDGEEGSKSRCHVCASATTLHVLHMYPKT